MSTWFRQIFGLPPRVDQLEINQEDMLIHLNSIQSQINSIVGEEQVFFGAFPTAYGAGANVSGGRGGTVYKVTNLNNSGVGSFRDAVSASNRIIIFDVSGTIELTASLTITANNLTIAGQSAPQGGIAITGEVVYFSGCDNVICRYVRFRPDYNNSGSVDALNAQNITNCIFDHCSISWGGDEAFSIIGTSNNITVQNCLFAESATGMLAGDSSSPISDNFSILNNAWYNISHRFPNATAGRLDIINNIVHNWFTRLRVIANHDGCEVNEINNYYQSGTKTGNPSSPDWATNWLDIGSSSQRANIRIYSDGNVYPGYLTEVQDDWTLYWHRFAITSGAYAGTSQWDPANTDFKSSKFALLGRIINPISAASVLTDIPDQVGANAYLNLDGTKVIERDSVDTTYVNNIKNQVSETYSYPPTDIISKQSYIDWHAAVSSTPINTKSSYDTSGDGMPDVWKTAKGLNPATDDSAYVWPSGYIGIEEYLNEIDN